MAVHDLVLVELWKYFTFLVDYCRNIFGSVVSGALFEVVVEVKIQAN